MIAKDGIRLIIYTGVLFLAVLIPATYFDILLLKIIGGILGILFLFNFFFLRDPDRKTPLAEELIISPADGTVIKIAEVEEALYLKEKVRLISIFMSVFNVHVNRIPMSGTVDYLDYKKGRYLAAFAEAASEVNEQSIIGISNGRGKLLFKQIAGILARRVIYHLQLGEQVVAGKRFGLIRYGSRLDVFLPLSAEVKVSMKDKVKSGCTILAEFKK